MTFDRLTPQQKVVATLLMEGYGVHSIARNLHWPRRTVKHYLTQMYNLYGITDGVKEVKLAVALTYERKPELIPWTL